VYYESGNAIPSGRCDLAGAFGFYRWRVIRRLMNCASVFLDWRVRTRKCAAKPEPQTQQQNESHDLHCTDFLRICRFEPMAHGRMIRQSDSRRQNRFAVNGEIRVLWTDDAGTDRISRATVLNVSKSGLQLRVDDKVPLRAYVFCNDRGLGICGRGSVRYCNAVKGKFVIGLEFSGGTGWNEPAEQPVV
jgi:hypothetical protein